MAINEAWVALSLLRHIGNKTMDSLLTTFGSCEAILEANKDDLLQVRGIGQKIAESIVAIDLEMVQRNIGKWQNAGIDIIPQSADHYPQLLSSIPDPPLTLFARGNYQPETGAKTVALVGTRHPSAQAKALTRYLALSYAEAGWIVVSGLALGIDTQAHIGALESNTSPTIAVLGGGVLNIYPPQNEALANRIIQRGVLLSENDPDATASAARLITRNRIISALCQRIIVVQTELDGGAMYAAKAAQKQGRAVFTVDWQFSGNQALLQAGAEPINPHAPVIPSA